MSKRCRTFRVYSLTYDFAWDLTNMLACLIDCSNLEYHIVKRVRGLGIIFLARKYEGHYEINCWVGLLSPIIHYANCISFFASFSLGN